MASSKLSIVIPAYNEEDIIAESVVAITNFFKLQKLNFEILVVDDGSTDKTAAVIKELSLKNLRLLKNGRNRGKGFSVKKGVKEAEGDIVLFTDADLSTPIEQFDKLREALVDCEVAIGSRVIKGAEIRKKQPFHRLIMGRIFNIIVRLLTGLNYRDTQCGFKLFSADAAKRIFRAVKAEGFGFDVEVLMLAEKFGYRVKEVPVVWINRAKSKVWPLRDTFRMTREVLEIRSRVGSRKTI
ncbi:glycosyltransferase family 2 protein [Candidatus Woesearchaeota archaeon]|nr:glycosyltransferase family 2 protein [Candidatus Woesearchaeota archaeon]